MRRPVRPREQGNFEVYLGYACNRSCRFCFVEKGARGSFGKPPPFRETAGTVLAAAKKGFRSLSLLGGEPTLYPSLDKLVMTARKAGFQRIVLFTNGLRLADRAFARRLATAGLDGVTFNLPSHLREKFEYLTRGEGTFQTVLRALENISELGIPAAAVCVLNRVNFSGLKDYAAFYSARGIRAFVLQHMKLQGNVNPSTNPGNPDLASLKIKMGRCLPAIRGMVSRCLELGIPPPFIEFIPPCLLPEMTGRLLEFRPHGRPAGDFACWHPGSGTERTFDVAYRDRVKFPGCGNCVYDGRCRGVDRNYAEVFGSGEFRPVLRVPAQFHSALKGAQRRLATAGFEKAMLSPGRRG